MPTPPDSPTSRAVRSLVLAALSFSLMALCARFAGRLETFEIVFVRSLLTLVMTWVLLRRAGLGLWGAKGHRHLLVMRGVFGFLALSCFFYSVTHLPLAEATVIQFGSPIFTALIAALYLGERASGRLAGAIVLGLAGVLLITRPAFLFAGSASELHGPTVLVAVAGAIFTSCAHVVVRRLAPLEDDLVIIFYFPLIAGPASLAAALPGWLWPRGLEWLYLAGVALAAQSGQVYLTRGMRHLPAASAAVVLYVQIVFAVVWGVLFLGERPDLWTVGGSLLVLAGILAAGRRPRLVVS